MMETLFSKKTCRTCMKNDGKLRSIFSSNRKQTFKFSEMLELCAAIQINEDDELPKQICSKCIYNLNALYQFRQICVESDQNFRRKLVELRVSKCDNVPKDEPVVLNGVPMCASLELVKIDTENNTLVCENLESVPELSEEKSLGIEENVDIVCGNKELRSSDCVEEKVVEKLKKVRRKIVEVKTKKVSKPHQCEICGKFLSGHSNLIQHMRLHTGERPYKCDECGKAFSRAEHLTIHKRIHTGEKPHSCDVCGKSFVQYTALACHYRTHTGERPHACPACGKTFAQAVTLTYHMRTHTGETPFICKICGKGFTHSGNLNIHMRFHNGERPFVCNSCGQRFVTSSHLSVHIKQHTGEKNHSCNICGKAFIRKEHLRSHILSHTGQKPYCCTLCGKCYSQSSHLSRHMKSHQSASLGL